ncbi:Uncharacterised protein [Mycobacteroides abscessus subsp. abscessus]|nr:Uncharacterised protein [Mycobacteroides abscessus subsp. abscessus]
MLTVPIVPCNGRTPRHRGVIPLIVSKTSIRSGGFPPPTTQIFTPAVPGTHLTGEARRDCHSAAPGAGARASVRDLRACAVLRHTLRVLRFQHLHRRRAGRGNLARRLAGGLACRAGVGGANPGGESAGRDGVRRGRYAVPAGWFRARRGARCDRRTFRAGTRGRGHHGGQSRVHLTGFLRHHPRGRTGARQPGPHLRHPR